jgi:hypothetical protein
MPYNCCHRQRFNVDVPLGMVYNTVMSNDSSKTPLYAVFTPIPVVGRASLPIYEVRRTPVPPVVLEWEFPHETQGLSKALQNRSPGR